MRMLIGMGIMLFWAAVSHGEPGFDQRYERDYNIFNPVTKYQPDMWEPATSLPARRVLLVSDSLGVIPQRYTIGF